MISVQEIKPIKLSGISSLLVSFPYSPELVEAVKCFTPAVYHKSIQSWEIPMNHLSKLLDKLAYYDEVMFTLLPPDSNAPKLGKLQESEISGFKLKPFSHQIEAVDFMLEHPKSLVLDSMGLGKSLEAMCFAETLHKRGLIKHCMIICGVDSLRQNWKSEIKKCSNESCMVLGERINRNGKITYESLTKRAEQLKNPIDEFFIIVNITNVRDDKFVEAFKKSANEIDLIIFDEAHRASKKSQQGSNLLKLKANYKVAMTGTLLTNSPLSAYLSLSWTDNDAATLTNFKAQYCEFGGFGGNQITGYKNLDLLQEEIDNCSIRRTFSQVRDDMPLKTVEYELVEMSDAHQKFYDAIKAGVKEEADKIELNTSNILALTTRLRQATACPTILTTEEIESSKLERAAELIEDIIESGEKVVVMSNFKEPVYRLATKLIRFRPLVGTGDQSEDQVSQNIEAFRNSPNFNLLLGTHGKIGTGFSMPEAHYMICIDTPFTAAQLNQSIDRIYRITSNQPIYVKILTCKDTIDERVRQIVVSKQDLSDYMIDHIDNDLADSLRNILLEL